MKYFDGVTGELLTEAALLKANTKNITIDGDDYKIMRTLLCLSNPASYVDNSTISSEGGIMTFYTQEEYDQTVKLMKKLGIKIKDTTINNAHDDPQNDIPTDIPSPYPSNKEIRKNKTF